MRVRDDFGSRAAVEHDLGARREGADVDRIGHSDLFRHCEEPIGDEAISMAQTRREIAALRSQ